MSGETIMRMANQIATFFRTAADGAAPEQVAAHINEFWDPRMRRQLRAMLAADTKGFAAEVIAAAGLIRVGDAEAGRKA